MVSICFYCVLLNKCFSKEKKVRYGFLFLDVLAYVRKFIDLFWQSGLTLKY